MPPFEAAFGQPLADGRYTVVQDPQISLAEQIAVCAQGDLKPTDRLTLTTGIRRANAKATTSVFHEGPVVGPPVNDTGGTEQPVTAEGGRAVEV